MKMNVSNLHEHWERVIANGWEHGKESQDHTEDSPQEFEVLVVTGTGHGRPVRPQSQKAQSHRQEGSVEESCHEHLDADDQSSDPHKVAFMPLDSMKERRLT